MHDYCDARPTVTFPAIGHLTGTNLYCLVTEAHVYEQLAQGRYLKAEWLGVETTTLRESNVLTTMPTGHITGVQAQHNLAPD